MNYLDIEEERHFQWGKTFFDLLTMNELESVAEETGLRKAMGERIKLAPCGQEGPLRRGAAVRHGLCVSRGRFRSACCVFRRT